MSSSNGGETITANVHAAPLYDPVNEPNGRRRSIGPDGSYSELQGSWTAAISPTAGSNTIIDASAQTGTSESIHRFVMTGVDGEVQGGSAAVGHNWEIRTGSKVLHRGQVTRNGSAGGGDTFNRSFSPSDVRTGVPGADVVCVTQNNHGGTGECSVHGFWEKTT
ncbi:MAG: hypothetical protein VW405_07510 [Rhodospirillaceae bacterium]